MYDYTAHIFVMWYVLSFYKMVFHENVLNHLRLSQRYVYNMFETQRDDHLVTVLSLVCGSVRNWIGSLKNYSLCVCGCVGGGWALSTPYIDEGVT